MTAAPQESGSRDPKPNSRLAKTTKSGFQVSRAKLADLGILVEHRLNMWRDIHPEFGKQIDRSRAYTLRWLREKVANGELVGFIARAPDGTVAGSGCVWLREEQPRPNNPLHVVPYLMSMYTEKEFRRRGVAREVLKQALKWSRANHHRRMVLHASDQGRHLYTGFGFGPTSEMRLDL